jgi:ubiquinone/menaquinone biosynthesis C-methylase UbiE
MANRRRRLLARASGRVLEVGAGTGLNVCHYPDAVTELVLVEPSLPMLERLDRRLERVRVNVDLVRARAESLPFPDAAFDCVVATFLLCTVSDPARSLLELARVLRPDGLFLFMEHVRSGSRMLARCQDALAPLWARLANGCQCNRCTLETLRQSPLALISLSEVDWAAMPFLVRPTIEGIAILANGGRR